MNDDAHANQATRQEFLTARQLAAVLQISASTVLRLAREGRIPVVRLTPHLLRFHLPSVREALDGTKTARANRRPPSATDDLQLSFDDLR
ncbi:MAG: helix-turn-helix transcriptional regulator [Pyrinomonadaceae bacterium]|nr:helix-turn-helix domain-containing protein [Acidobacteriota bacterium]